MLPVLPIDDDLIEIKTGRNQLIENNNQQRKINIQLGKILETLDPKSVTEELIIAEVYKELEIITNTINFAKTGSFYSGTLNFKDSCLYHFYHSCLYVSKYYYNNL